MNYVIWPSTPVSQHERIRRHSAQWCKWSREKGQRNRRGEEREGVPFRLVADYFLETARVSPVRLSLPDLKEHLLSSFDHPLLLHHAQPFSGEYSISDF